MKTANVRSSRDEIACIEFTRYGARTVLIGPEHPEYEALRDRDYEAAVALDRWEFEHGLRGVLEMLIVQIAGAA